MRSVIFLYICNQKFYVLLNMVYLKESVVLKAKNESADYCSNQSKFRAYDCRKKFREDLYYRLNVINIPIYPLRSRREDILELAHWFINKYTRKLGNKVGGFSEEAEKLLLLYKWPGNVRELENAIEYALNFESSQIINAASLPKKSKRNL